jgi:hypothetical protein
MAVALVGIVCIATTLRLTAVYSSTWWGKGDWDWSEYQTLLSIRPSKAFRRFEDPREQFVEQRNDAPQGRDVLHMKPSIESVHGLDVLASKVSGASYRHAMISAWVRTDSKQPTAILEFVARDQDSLCYRQEWYVLETIQEQGEWTHYRRRMALPRNCSLQTHYIVRLANPQHADFLIDDIVLQLY